MARRLDLESWPRRRHFEFFKDYQQPFFNLCAEVDVSRLHVASRAEGGPSFFLASLYLSLRAANEIEPFRYRIRGDTVVVHEPIHGGSTVLRRDQTFGFAYFDYRPAFAAFAARAADVLEAAGAMSGRLEPRPERDDLIHYSVIPWVRFTSFAHARRLPVADSIPKIVFGRHVQEAGARRMPVSVEVHHALMDGLHVGQFLDRFQSYLDDPEAL